MEFHGLCRRQLLCLSERCVAVTPASVQHHPQTHGWVLNMQLGFNPAIAFLMSDDKVLSQGREKTETRVCSPTCCWPQVELRNNLPAEFAEGIRSMQRGARLLSRNLTPLLGEPETSVGEGRTDSLAPWMQTVRGGSWHG